MKFNSLGKNNFYILSLVRGEDIRIIDVVLQIQHEQMIITNKDGAVLDYKTSTDFDKNIDLSLVEVKLSVPNKGSNVLVVYQDEVVVAKQCTKCKFIHLLDNYHISISNLAGKVPKCKICIYEERKRTEKIPLNISIKKNGFSFISPLLETYNLESNIDISEYLKVKAYIIKDRRSKRDLIVFYESKTMIAKQCRECDELLLLSLFASKNRGFGGCAASCRKCSQKDSSNQNLELSVIDDILIIGTESKSIYKETTLQGDFTSLINFESLKAMYVKHKNKSDIYTVVVYENDQMVFKECDRCDMVKHISEFHNKKRGLGGKMGCCRECRNSTSTIRNRLIITEKENAKFIQKKSCSKCNILKPLSEYREGNGAGDRGSTCIPCQNVWHEQYRSNNKLIVSMRKKQSYKKDIVRYKKKSRMYYSNNKDSRKRKITLWSQNNPDKIAVYRLNRMARREALPNSLTKKELEDIMNDFQNLCALSGMHNNIHHDHFICLASGHGGTYKGNIIPLNGTLNIKKHENNPFEWIKDQPIEYRENFNTIVRYLASQNNLSYEDYTEFVYWCYENRRDIDQIKKDARTSLELWKSDVAKQMRSNLTI